MTGRSTRRTQALKGARTSKRTTAADDRPAAKNERGHVAVDANRPTTLDLPEVWGHGSFPASDPPANW